MKKIIFGFTGQMASGKGTVAEFFAKEFGATTYTFSKMLRDTLTRFYLPVDRDGLIKMSEFIRSTFGEDTMARTMSLDVENDTNDLIIIEGIRREADIKYLKKMNNFILVRIEADIERRYERLIKRDEKSDDKLKTFEEFKADHERSTEKSIEAIERQALESINNDGTMQELQTQLITLLNRYR